jgi:hypothetical protein
MKILLWRISTLYEEEKYSIFSSTYFESISIDPYEHLIPDIDRSFYNVYACKDDYYVYIVLDIYQVTADLPNKDYIYPLLRKVYDDQIRKSRKKMLRIQKEICQNTFSFDNQIHNDLYFHQIHNITWMEQVEQQEYFPILQKPYLLLTDRVAINIQTFELKYKKDIIDYTKIPGGCLMDDYGMGKTRCLVNLCEKKKSVETIHPFHLNSTLIICPHDVCLHWRDEILYINPAATIKILATPSDTDLFTNADYVIMSFKYFSDFHKKGYDEYRFENLSLSESISAMKRHCYDIHKLTNQVTNYRWRRLIMDDIHEIFRLQQNDYFLNAIHQIDSDFRWAITGQQIFHSEAITNILKFLMSTNDVSKYTRDDNFRYYMKRNFRKTINPQSSNIPVQEEILQFTSLEQNGYLKWKNQYDRQSYCLFPIIDSFTMDEVFEIFQDKEMTLRRREQLGMLTDEEIQEDYRQPLRFLNQNYSNIMKMKCDICFMDIKRGNLSVSKCGHHGCFECMIKSQEINQKCPFCRTSLGINEIYLIQEQDQSNFHYGPKIRKLLDDIIKLSFLKTVVYVESQNANRLVKILENERVPVKILRGSLRYKYNLIKQFENILEPNFLLIITETSLNYNFSCVDRVIILENWYKDIENKLKNIITNIGHKKPFSNITQYMINNTIETGNN